MQTYFKKWWFWAIIATVGVLIYVNRKGSISISKTGIKTTDLPKADVVEAA